MIEALPEGWTRHLYDPALYKGDEKYFFTFEGLHDRIFPFPLQPAEVNQTVHGVIPQQIPYISCQTKKAWVNAHRNTEKNFGIKMDDTAPTAVDLKEVSGNTVGRIALHHNDDLLYFAEDPATGTSIELVAISRHILHSGVHRYAVLWIEWVEKVAYRRASGDVDKDWWENESGCEDVSLVLG